MIRWINDQLGTGAYEKIVNVVDDSIVILDVRELVDKTGNNSSKILEKIKEGKDYLEQGKKVVVCCDYGMSRSNAIAAGILTMWQNLNFTDALQKVMEQTGENNIKLQMIRSVEKAINKKNNNSIERRKILVLGSSGFIGKNLIPLLKEKYVALMPSHREIDVLNDTAKLAMYVSENQITDIINLAIPKVYNCNKAISDSLLMLKNIVDVCEEYDLHLIHISSWEIYSGYISNYLLANENLEGNPKGIYGDIKFLSDILLKVHTRNQRLKLTIVRSSPIYGVGGDRPKLIYNFIEKAKANKTIFVHQYLNDLPRLDYIYISDFCNAFLKIIESKLTGEFNVGTGNIVSTTQIAEILIEKLNSKSKIEKVLIEEHCSNICMDTTKISNLLGWKANTNINEGLQRILDDCEFSI